MTPPVALTIAGSDSGGGAGIQADLKTFAALGVFGTSAITAVTAQNTRGVTGFVALAPEFVAAQVAAVLDDLPVRAVKTGMLANRRIVETVATQAAAGVLPQLVVDPVLVAASGDALFEAGSEVDPTPAYQQLLFPHATVITPNLREVGALLGRPLESLTDMADAAAELATSGARCVVVKGGHLTGTGESVDVVWRDGAIHELRAPRIGTRNGHGTGCTFASAIAAGLAAGLPLPAALDQAKRYVTAALAGAQDWRLGTGAGPLHHFVPFVR